MKRVLTLVASAAILIATPQVVNAEANDASAACRVTTVDANLSYAPLAHRGAESGVVVRVRCHARGRLSIAISAGRGESGSYAVRRMHRVGGGSDRLEYNLVYDGRIFGDGTDGTSRFVRTFGMVDGDVEDAFLVHVSARADQDVSIGHYSDSLELTLSY